MDSCIDYLISGGEVQILETRASFGKNISFGVRDLLSIRSLFAFKLKAVEAQATREEKPAARFHHSPSHQQRSSSYDLYGKEMPQLEATLELRVSRDRWKKRFFILDANSKDKCIKYIKKKKEKKTEQVILPTPLSGSRLPLLSRVITHFFLYLILSCLFIFERTLILLDMKQSI